MDKAKTALLMPIGPKSLPMKTLTVSSCQRFTFGRSKNAACTILDVKVSREHASLDYDHKNHCWTVTDNQSANGVLVNGEPIGPQMPKMLNNRDLIRLGPVPDYEWRLVVSSTMEMEKKMDAKLMLAFDRISKERQSLETRVKAEKVAQEQLTKDKLSLLKVLTQERLEFEEKQKVQKSDFDEKLFATKEEGEKQRQALEQRLQEERNDMEKRIAQQQTEMAAKVSDGEKKMQEVLRERDVMLESLQVQKQKAEQKMNEERERYMEHIRDLEAKYRDSQVGHEEALAEVNRELELRLQRDQVELEEAVEREKAKREAERQKLSEELRDREVEIKKLNDQLRQAQNAEDKRAKKVPKLDILGKCNDELKCTVCDELFITPMSLNCGHVFCRHCISQWQLKCGGAANCPNCRQMVTSTSRSLHLENLIEAIFSDANESIREERKRLVAERQAEIDSKTAESKAPRKRKRDGETTPVSIRNWAVPVGNSNTNNTTQEVSSSSEDEDEGEEEEEEGSDNSDLGSDDSSTSSVEGVPGYYYGGYGSCFECGHRGHWAPGCPFK